MIDIRRWINLIESVEYVTLSGAAGRMAGGPVAVHRNPASLSMIRSLDELRGLVDGRSGDTYWWDSHLATHRDIAKELGLDYRNAACVVLQRYHEPPLLIIYDKCPIIVASASLRYLAADVMVALANTSDKTPISFQQFVQQNGTFS